MNLNNLLIIGTSHIAEQSVKEVRKSFKEFDPDIIAIELDHNRLKTLFKKQKRSLSPAMIFQIGLFGYLFVVIGGYVQKKLGKFVNIEPGSEMKTAVIIAKKNNKQIALVDQDISITLRKLSMSFGRPEIWQMIKDFFRSIFFSKQEMKKMGFDTLDLTKVPADEVIEKMMKQLEERYPRLHKTLIDDRNKVMAMRLQRIMENEPEKKIMAVMGAGHVKGVEDILKNNKLDITYSFSIS